MQNGDLIINYDLHWNPVKLIQRFGRIDRIGSEKETIYGFNFLPELGIERNLGFTHLVQIYYQHALHKLSDCHSSELKSQPISTIVCSKELI